MFLQSGEKFLVLAEILCLCVCVNEAVVLRNVSLVTLISPYKVSPFITQRFFLSASLLPSNHVLCFCLEDKTPTPIGQKISWDTPESRRQFYSFDINLTPCFVCLFICFTSQNAACERKQKSSIQNLI